jgi:hypothetical protein
MFWIRSRDGLRLVPVNRDSIIRSVKTHDDISITVDNVPVGVYDKYEPDEYEAAIYGISRALKQNYGGQNYIYNLNYVKKEENNE